MALWWLDFNLEVRAETCNRWLYITVEKIPVPHPVEGGSK